MFVAHGEFSRANMGHWSGIQNFRNTVQESEADMELQKIKDQLNLWADNGGLRPLDVDISLQNICFRTQWRYEVNSPASLPKFSL